MINFNFVIGGKVNRISLFTQTQKVNYSCICVKLAAVINHLPTIFDPYEVENRDCFIQHGILYNGFY